MWRKTSTFALVELSSKKFIILTEIFNSYISTRLLFFLRNKTRNFLSLGSKFFQLLYFPLHTVVNQTCHSLIVTWNYLFNIYPPPLGGKDFRKKNFNFEYSGTWSWRLRSSKKQLHMDISVEIYSPGSSLSSSITKVIYSLGSSLSS